MALLDRAQTADGDVPIRSLVYVTLSYDHRVVDGAVAHQFVDHSKKSPEN